VSRPDLIARVAARDWYHTLELAPGVVTPGWFDLRYLPGRIGFPTDLHGQRCLDVGTFDGFWAFAMERRDAAEVVALDVPDPAEWDWPVGAPPEAIAQLRSRHEGGTGFPLAREALGSKVQRVERTIYALDPEVDGTFDFVYVGSLLLHLRDPVGALERVRGVCRGQLLVVDAVDLPLSLALPRRPVASLDGIGRPWWWRPNRAGLVRMVEAAGFALTGPPRTVLMPPGAGHPKPAARAALRLVRSRVGRELLFAGRVGGPHLAVHAQAPTNSSGSLPAGPK
jgi:tRNA (mo5U34)-methyltransferase